MSDHLAKFGVHSHCGSGDIMFLICYLDSRDNVFKGLCGFVGGSTSRFVVS